MCGTTSPPVATVVGLAAIMSPTLTASVFFDGLGLASGSAAAPSPFLQLDLKFWSCGPAGLGYKGRCQRTPSCGELYCSAPASSSRT
jgi:hypothetical protein